MSRDIFVQDIPSDRAESDGQEVPPAKEMARRKLPGRRCAVERHRGIRIAWCRCGELLWALA